MVFQTTGLIQAHIYDTQCLSVVLKPLVKWAGGKRQLLPSILKMLPESFETYIEPFAGGCALLVGIYNLGKLKHAVISDLNEELINLYAVVKNDPEALIAEIDGMSFTNDSNSYYLCRDRFNALLGQASFSRERAALFLYLNRHGYNGLWRVNGSGKFNVPFGRYSHPLMPAPDHIREFSAMLSSVDIYSGDFTRTCRIASGGDLVYLDPPYFPVSITSNFTGYSRGGFSMDQQSRLRTECEDMDRRGVKFIFNNSCAPEISKLYDKFFRYRVPSTRMINRNSDGRMGHYDLLGSNFAVAGTDSMMVDNSPYPN